jgi:hypothetical protein
MTRRLLRSVVACATACLVSGSVALAHNTGHESRTRAECERLPGTTTTGERANCLACISRQGKWHYHSDYAAGNRCRPDDGSP